MHCTLCEARGLLVRFVLHQTYTVDLLAYAITAIHKTLGAQRTCTCWPFEALHISQRCLEEVCAQFDKQLCTLVFFVLRAVANIITHRLPHHTEEPNTHFYPCTDMNKSLRSRVRQETSTSSMLPMAGPAHSMCCLSSGPFHWSWCWPCRCASCAMSQGLWRGTGAALAIRGSPCCSRPALEKYCSQLSLSYAGCIL